MGRDSRLPGRPIEIEIDVVCRATPRKNVNLAVPVEIVAPQILACHVDDVLVLNAIENVASIVVLDPFVGAGVATRRPCVRGMGRPGGRLAHLSIQPTGGIGRCFRLFRS